MQSKIKVSFALALIAVMLAFSSQTHAGGLDHVTRDYEVEFEQPIQLLADEPVGQDGGIDAQGRYVTSRKFFHQRRVKAVVKGRSILVIPSWGVLDFTKQTTGDGVLLESRKALNLNVFNKSEQITLLQHGVEAEHNTLMFGSKHPQNARTNIRQRVSFTEDALASKWSWRGSLNRDSMWISEVHLKPIRVRVTFEKGKELVLREPTIFTLPDGTKVRVKELKKK